MQTFFTSNDLKENAKVLDNRRLGKQRVECLQILFILYAKKTGCIYIRKQNGTKIDRIIKSFTNKIYTNCIENAELTKKGIPKKIGHLNHPIMKMWENFENSLFRYMEEIVKEWKARGFKDTTLEKAREILIELNTIMQIGCDELIYCPLWWHNKNIMESHKSNLLKKDKAFYGKYNWNVSENLPYVWSV